MYSEDVPTTVDKFYVPYKGKPTGVQFFEMAKEALDFYAQKLKEQKGSLGRLKMKACH
jgi:hypothetical protein